MYSTTAIWPASYQGVSFLIRTLADGTFQGETANGYITAPSDNLLGIIDEVMLWIDAQTRKGE